MKHRAKFVLQTLLLGATAASFVPAQEAQVAQPPHLRYLDNARHERETGLRELSTATLGRTVRYRLQLSEGDQSELSVEVDLECTAPGDLLLVMPAWAPGSYHLANHGRHVQDLTVSSAEGTKLEVERPKEKDPNLWRVKGARPGKLTVSYRISARSSRVAGRRPRRNSNPDRPATAKPCFQFNGPAVWLHEIRHKSLPCEVTLSLPRDWLVSTGLRPGEGTTGGRLGGDGTWKFTAPDYDVLIDCPTRMGIFETFSFRIGKVPFEISLVGADRDRTDRQEFAMRVKKISKHFIDMFGGAPMDRYVYLFRVPGGGGLEHLNSTAIGLMNLKGSVPGHPSMWDFVIAHEFFHLWNVKRLRPEALGPFDYTGPNRTTALWFSEGVTSYYGYLCLPRVGLVSPTDYWRHMSGKYTTLRKNPVRKKVSVADSSWKVWDGNYFLDRKRIDYYLKGECLGLLLDVLIRDASGNKQSLDDVMRALYEQCTKTGKGFAEDDIRNLSSKLAGADLGDFFDNYVYGTEDLPVETVLPKAGVQVSVTGTGAQQRITLRADPDATGLALEIRKSLMNG